MHCLTCGGSFEYAGANKEYARCTKCLALHQVVRPGQVAMMDVRAPDGTVNPDFSAMYAQQLGFAPRAASHHVVGVGGVNVVMNTARMQNSLRDWIWSKIWGLVITAVALVIVIIAIIGVILWAGKQAKDAQAESSANQSSTAQAIPKTVSWDGKTPYTCGGTEHVTIENTTANLTSGPAISAMGSCDLTLNKVNITAPTGISAMGKSKITMKGGSIKSSGEAISAMGATVEIVLEGAKITGKTSTMGGAKISGLK